MVCTIVPTLSNWMPDDPPSTGDHRRGGQAAPGGTMASCSSFHLGTGQPERAAMRHPTDTASRWPLVVRSDSASETATSARWRAAHPGPRST